MATFYRLAFIYLWHEKVLSRFQPSAEALEAMRSRMWTEIGARYRDRAIAMGGLLIKAGQILSGRSDIFPPEFTRALASLQDEVPGVPFAAIRQVIESEFGRPLLTIYPRFEETPLAAASLGQVHVAALPSGEEVVVKVLRPGVDDLIRADLEGFRQVVRFLIRWTRWAKGLDLPGIFFETYHIMTRELDLREEARSTDRFQRMFEDMAEIAIPRVHHEFTRQRVLTLEFMPGIKLSDKAGIEAAGIVPGEVARLLVLALNRQTLSQGLFHADPHPGNVLVQPGPVVVLLDFGMVGQLTPRHRSALKRAAVGLLSRDPDGIVAALDELEMLRPTADRLALRRTIAWVLEKQTEGNLFELRPEAFLEIIQELRKLLHTRAFQFPADIAFLGRGTSITLGNCRVLDPQGDFIAFVESSTRQNLDAGREAASTMAEIATDLARLPARLDRVLTAIERGGGVRGAAQESGGAIPAKVDRRTFWLGLAAISLIAGNQWWPAGAHQLATLCWAIALVALAWAGWRSLPPRPLEP